ncbi:MAG: TolC family protein [Gammaproteobacteria bacterium]|nr:TolC family protein [Gammaproteobacteria bacterium]
MVGKTLLFVALSLCPLLVPGIGSDSFAQSVDPLPQPLTLEHALALDAVEHPSLQQSLADQRAAQARALANEAENDLTVSLEARARWVQPPSIAGDEALDDHKGSLFVRKSLYDFGRSRALQQAAGGESRAMAVRYQSQYEQRRLAIMRAFYDVLLADQENFRDNEAMAVAYITLDRARTRRELGQGSDIEVLEQEQNYQRIRLQLLRSGSQQRLTRSRLANQLNRPGELPSELATPALRHVAAPLPDYEQLLAGAQQHNPTLRALQLELDAARARVDAARSEKHPRLDAELEASSYSRDVGSNDRWRAGVTLSVPLYNGDRISAAVAREQAAVLRLQAQLELARQELRQALLEIWLDLQYLMQQREQARSELAYRELYLDWSRANYEMEVKADLGDAMVRLSDAQLALTKTDFDAELAWEQLYTLLGVESKRADEAVGESQGELQ